MCHTFPSCIITAWEREQGHFTPKEAAYLCGISGNKGYRETATCCPMSNNHKATQRRTNVFITGVAAAYVKEHLDYFNPNS